jgi:hypothetical protein
MMKTRSVFIAITILSIYCGYGQKSAMFETTVYVIDAVGNVDSVVIGYDLDANAEYNPQFGEHDITDPFDSIFEIRAGHGLDYHGLNHDIILSERIIGGIESTGYIPDQYCYDGREPIILFIRAIHKPVTVYWDSSAFNENWCTRGSIISSHDAHLATPFWYEWEELLALTACMTEFQSFQDSLTWHGWQMGILQPVNGFGVDTVLGIMVTALHQESALAEWCGDGIVYTHEIERSQTFVAYPNPVTDMMYFERPVSSFILTAVDGRVIITGDQTSTLDLSGLQRGFYLLLVTLDDFTDSVLLKVVKQ